MYLCSACVCARQCVFLCVWTQMVVTRRTRTVQSCLISKELWLFVAQCLQQVTFSTQNPFLTFNAPHRLAGAGGRRSHRGRTVGFLRLYALHFAAWGCNRKEEKTPERGWSEVSLAACLSFCSRQVENMWRGTKDSAEVGLVFTLVPVDVRSFMN